MAELVIRPPEDADLARLTEIYNHFILNTPVTFEVEPYTVEMRRSWLAQFSTSGRYRCLVGVEDGNVVGWAHSRRFHERAAYDPTIESTIYLDPAVHGRGIGRRLYGALFEALAGEDIHRVVAGVTLPNEASLALHRRFGFQPMGVIDEVGRKFGKWWDVGWFVKALP